MNMKQANTVFEHDMSALADGELHGEALAAALQRLGTDDELRATWQTWHVVGDVLRSGGHAPCSAPTAFMSRLQQRLAAEAPLLPMVAAVPVRAPVRVEAANEPVFRWKLVAGAASLAAAAAIGWTWVGSGLGGAPAAQLASAPATAAAPASVLAAADLPANRPAALVPARVVVGGGAPQVMLRDPRLDELLDAHRQITGGFQMPSDSLRNAAFESMAGR